MAMTAMASWSGMKRSLVERRRKQKAEKLNIAEMLDAKRVLDGLSEAQRNQILDCVFSADLHYRFRERLGPYDQRADRFFKRGPGQLRKLGSKLAKLHAAFKGVREQAATIASGDTTPSGNFYLAEALDDDCQLSERLRDTAAALDRIKIPDADIFETIPGHRTSADDPTNDITQALFDYLTKSCGLRKNDASQRIARIGNTLWGWNIQEADRSESYTPDRSAAVHKRLKRLPSASRR